MDAVRETPWKKHFWRNLAASYVGTIVRLGTSVLLFPMLYRYLSREQFGFWCLLWGVLGYTVLVDFGMGVTATLEVARRRISGEWLELSHLLSTIFWSYMAFFCIVETVALLLRPQVLAWIHTSPQSLVSFGHVYVVFTLIVGATFPLGLYPEILRGLQRMDVAYALWTGGQLSSFALLCLGVALHWSFLTLVVCGVCATTVPYGIAFFAVRRFLPQVSLHPRMFSLAHLRPVLSFSFTTYLLTICAIIVSRTDQVTISLCLGVAMVAVYQVGYKVSELFYFALSQVGTILTQAAAHSSSTRNRAEIDELLEKSTQLTILVATPAFAVTLLYLDPLIHLLTGMWPVPAAYHIIGVILLVGRYSALLTQACACPVFLGAGYERQLLWMNGTEAVVNLVVSVVLAFKLGVVGVAVGTLVPGMLVGWLWAVPLTLRFTRRTFLQWMAGVWVPIAIPLACSLLIVAMLPQIWPVADGHNAWSQLFASCALATLPVALYLWTCVRKGFWDRGESAPQPVALCAGND